MVCKYETNTYNSSNNIRYENIPKKNRILIFCVEISAPIGDKY